MKTTELLNKLRNILSAERKAQLKLYSSLKKVLKSLRVEKNRLEENLETAQDEEERQEIASRLAVVSEQRKKGLKALKKIKKERK